MAKRKATTNLNGDNYWQEEEEYYQDDDDGGGGGGDGGSSSFQSASSATLNSRDFVSPRRRTQPSSNIMDHDTTAVPISSNNNFKEYIAKVASLNQSFLKNCQDDVNNDPACCLAPLIKDYLNYTCQLIDKCQKNNLSSSNRSCSSGSGNSSNKSFVALGAFFHKIEKAFSPTPSVVGNGSFNHISQPVSNAAPELNSFFSQKSAPTYFNNPNANIQSPAATKTFGSASLSSGIGGNGNGNDNGSFKGDLQFREKRKNLSTGLSESSKQPMNSNPFNNFSGFSLPNPVSAASVAASTYENSGVSALRDKTVYQNLGSNFNVNNSTNNNYSPGFNKVPISTASTLGGSLSMRGYDDGGRNRDIGASSSPFPTAAAPPPFSFGLPVYTSSPNSGNTSPSESKRISGATPLSTFSFSAPEKFSPNSSSSAQFTAFTFTNPNSNGFTQPKPEIPKFGAFSVGTSNSPNSNSGFNPNMKPMATSPSISGFSFTPMTSNAAPTATTASKESDEEKDDEPPKNEFTPVVESDSLYSTRCKVFGIIDGKYKDKGVGQLYVKKLDTGRHQLVVRADNSLGTVLLNLLLKEGLPLSKKSTKDIMTVDPTGNKGEPLTVLIRVKSEVEATQLLNKLTQLIKST